MLFDAQYKPDDPLLKCSDNWFPCFASFVFTCFQYLMTFCCIASLAHTESISILVFHLHLTLVLSVQIKNTLNL